LITDFRLNAPHLEAYLVLPGYIGTDISLNSTKAQKALKRGSDEVELSDWESKIGAAFRDSKFALSAVDAATIILRRVEQKRWRVLVGDDAEAMDHGGNIHWLLYSQPPMPLRTPLRMRRC
jgi:hypothetical protein